MDIAVAAFELTEFIRSRIIVHARTDPNELEASRAHLIKLVTIFVDWSPSRRCGFVTISELFKSFDDVIRPFWMGILKDALRVKRVNCRYKQNLLTL